MFTRLKHTAQGFTLGAGITLALCAAAYIHTHDIKFTATATNQAPELAQAEANAVSMAKLLPPIEQPAKSAKVKAISVSKVQQ